MFSYIFILIFHKVSDSDIQEEDPSGIRSKFWAEQIRMHKKHKQKTWDPEVNLVLLLL